MSVQSIVITLGYAGLIPFVIPALLVAAGNGYSDIAISTANTYAFAIICFLTGSWWGIASGTGNRIAIVLSNVYLVIAFLILLLAPTWWSFAAFVLLMGIYALERIMTLFPVRDGYYRSMRTNLTLIASGSMLVIHLAR